MIALKYTKHYSRNIEKLSKSKYGHVYKEKKSATGPSLSNETTVILTLTGLRSYPRAKF